MSNDEIDVVYCSLCEALVPLFSSETCPCQPKGSFAGVSFRVLGVAEVSVTFLAIALFLTFGFGAFRLEGMAGEFQRAAYAGIIWVYFCIFNQRRIPQLRVREQIGGR